jgi:hypothetical protein
VSDRDFFIDNLKTWSMDPCNCKTRSSGSKTRTQRNAVTVVPARKERKNNVNAIVKTERRAVNGKPSKKGRHSSIETVDDAATTREPKNERKVVFV